ncbi:MAG: amidase [Acidobacteria bacterium]|nr:amidase [Acidobacteriota bacterium]
MARVSREIVALSASELARRIRSRALSSREVVQAHLDRIAEWNPRLNAIVDLDAQGALEQAARADEALANGRPAGRLHGVPLTIKGCIDVQGLRSECGSRFRQGYVAERDATLVARLRRAGAVILGTTNTPDMLMAYETDNYLYGRSNNPWDLERTPGGSSGGEAAAIASGCSPAGFGSDGGGSVRVPAHFCGICGLKPTPGVIPRTGHWPSCVGPGAFLGLIGPMARAAEDLQLLLEATAGPEHHDPSAAPVDVSAPSLESLKAGRIGWAVDDGRTPVTPETAAAVEAAAKALERRGFELVPFSLEGLDDAIRVWWTLFGVAGATLTQPLVAGRESDVHPLSLGLFATREEAEAMTYPKFLDAWIERDRMRAKLLARMEGLTAFLCPTASVPAFVHGEREWRIGTQTVGYPEVFRYSQLFNLTGNPAVSVPSGSPPEGLPIGVQVVAHPFADASAVAVAALIQAEIGLPQGLARQ